MRTGRLGLACFLYFFRMERMSDCVRTSFMSLPYYDRKFLYDIST
jgi:hypothetical protein